MLCTLFALTAVTGMVDAVSFLALGHVFTANMTGNVVFLGFAIAGAPGTSAPRSIVALVVFAIILGLSGPAVFWLGVFGFFIQLAIPVLYAYVSELYPTELRASGFGWASSVSRVVTGFIPLIFGSLLWPVLGLPWTFTLMGVVVVACCAARPAGVAPATMMSTFRRANSTARVGSRSIFPAAARYSMTMFCPST